MKKYIFVIALALAIFIYGCQKPAAVNPQTTPSPYDVANKIFRVNVTANSNPFSVTITDISPNSTSPVNSEQGQSSSSFDYGFTPNVGDTVKVAAQSNTGMLTLSMSYLGVSIGEVNGQANSSGGSIANFVYVVKN